MCLCVCCYTFSDQAQDQRNLKTELNVIRIKTQINDYILSYCLMCLCVYSLFKSSLRIKLL